MHFNQRSRVQTSAKAQQSPYEFKMNLIWIFIWIWNKLHILINISPLNTPDFCIHQDL